MRIIRSIIFSVMLLSCSVSCQAQERPVAASADGIILKESFDGNSDKSTQRIANNIKLHGSATTVQGFKGNALQLTNGAYAEIELPTKLNTRSGTISFWVKPLWDKDDKQSHTLLSMRWDDGKNGYMTISQGWWEPDGADRLYFVLNNQEYMHCSVPYKLETGVWSLITVTWKNGEKGHCRLFIDDQKIAEFTKNLAGAFVSASSVYLGSDKGTSVQKKRSVDAVIDELAIYSHSVMDKDIGSHFESMGGNVHDAYSKHWKWLEEGLKLPLKQKRGKQGKLLEHRVIFDEDIAWATSREETDKILTRIKAAGFNVYVPCVWHGQGTHYPTSLTTPDMKLQHIIADGYDPLAYLIKKAHSLGIQVFPWFTVALRYDNRFPMFYDTGTPKDAYNIHNKEFRRFITDLMLDVVKRYDVDGINLDYIRTMGICTSSACKDDYFSKTGILFQMDYNLKDKFGTARSRIQQWQDAAVSEIVSSFSKQAKMLKPKLVISVDGHVELKDAERSLEGRNELEWAKRGWIDVIFNMDYRARVDYEKVSQAKDKLPDERTIIELFGNYEHNDDRIVPRSGLIIAKYMEFAQRAWPGNGMALYLYSMLSDEQIKFIKAGPFSEDAISDWSGSKGGP